MKVKVLWIVGLIAVVLLAGYLTGSRRNFGPALEPDSTAPDGAQALVELTDRLGRPMRMVDGAPNDSLDVVVLLNDRLERDDADRLNRWVARGGLLVVADPGSLLAPPIADAAFDDLGGGCAIAGLDAVQTLDVGSSRSLVVPDGATSCFSTAPGKAFLVVETRGDGAVVSLGGPTVFTNEFLDEADNAVLAAALFGGDRRSGFLRPSIPGSGDQTLVDLIDTPVRAALAQLAVAFLAVVIWRARRLGQPVTEPQAVAIDGSALTEAMSRLLANNRTPAHSAALLRDYARRTLSHRIGLTLDAPIRVVADALAAHTTLSAAEIETAIAQPVLDDATLVAVAQLLHRIREEIIHGTVNV